MAEREDTVEYRDKRERVAGREPEQSSYAEFRMPASARDDNHDEPQPRESSSPANGPLFTDEQARELHYDWENVQASFVDDPRQAVSQADQLVERTMRQITDTFARERQSLEQQWDSGDDVSTEELRRVLQRYRTFFNRLLSL